MEEKQPIVMGIININRESFYAPSRMISSEDVCNQYENMLKDGAKMTDIGACSTRPGSTPVTLEQEWEYLHEPLKELYIRYKNSTGFRNVISIDTFRSEIVRRVYDTIGEFTVNDISAGEADNQMLKTVAELKLPYIAMHMRGTPDTMNNLTNYPDGVVNEVVDYFKNFEKKAKAIGINDFVVDPGFGFAKTVEQNYQMMSGLKEFKKLGHKVLVGISRKSMIWKLLGITPADALPATCALNMVALINGADILRVHDVKEAAQCIQLYKNLEIK
ncbi:MAG: dihydropteroate synthase [Bacteroidales bacterium]|nr:dihydropteroate synthase [Bacteroidales bacterium]MCI1733986.1 dihydropteroate synthase [Bacteroidales bacterium]